MKLNVFFKEGAQNGPTGFTLIELMIALFIVTLVIAGYIGANIAAQRNTEVMHERTIALQDANRIMEQMRTASGNTTVPFPDNVTAVYANGHAYTNDPNNLPTGLEELPLTNETITVAYTNATADHPFAATVTVTWTSYTGLQCTEMVKTYITQR